MRRVRGDLVPCDAEVQAYQIDFATPCVLRNMSRGLIPSTGKVGNRNQLSSFQRLPDQSRLPRTKAASFKSLYLKRPPSSDPATTLPGRAPDTALGLLVQVDFRVWTTVSRMPVTGRSRGGSRC